MNTLDICNAALAIIGTPTIRNLDQDCESARQCKVLYPLLRDRMLRDHLWSFATWGEKLQKRSEKSYSEEFPILCSLPIDCLRVIKLADGSPYIKHGKRILVQSLPATVIYIRRIVDATEYDEVFCEALQYLLASEFCLRNTRDAQLSNLMKQNYHERLQAARSIDSQENVHARQPGRKHSNFLESRSL